MKNEKLKTGLILFVLGLIGVLSLLTVDLPTDMIPEKILEQYSMSTLKILSLINPIILLLIFVTIGVLLHQKVNLHVPILEEWLSGSESVSNKGDLIKSGVLGGIIAGVLLTLVGFLFLPVLPQAFVELGENFKPSPAGRLLYGGITEELITRFGIMTLFVWLIFKLTKSLSPVVYWVGILISSVLFGLMHFPIAFAAVGEPSALLLLYILLGNSLGGIIFGWLYWKKGLEAAILAHMFAHVVMMLAEPILAA